MQGASPRLGGAAGGGQLAHPRLSKGLRRGAATPNEKLKVAAAGKNEIQGGDGGERAGEGKGEFDEGHGQASPSEGQPGERAQRQGEGRMRE